MLRTAIYGLAILVAAVAVEYGASVQLSGIGMAVLIALSYLMPLGCGLAGAIVAMLSLPIRISWIGVVGFAPFYTFGCLLLIVALMPVVPMGLAKSIFSGQGYKAVGAVLALLSLPAGSVLLFLARGCLLRYSQSTAPNGPGYIFLTPALAISFATIAPLAPRIYEAYLESDHVHVVAHGPSMPLLALTLLSVIPGFVLVVCHDIMFRRSLDYLFWGRNLADRGGLVWGLVLIGLILGAIIVLIVSILMLSIARF